jgi:hypothetical protein
VTELRDGEPGKSVYLYIRKLEDGSIKYALCNESEHASIEDIRKPALMRWSIEQSFKECKNYLGMDHYETRSWIGWRRHILLTLISHLFILKLIHKFSTNVDYQLETPMVTKSVPLEEYLSEAEKHQNNQPITHGSVQVTARAPIRFLTIGIVMDVINIFIIKTMSALKAVDYKLKMNADAFKSNSKIKVDELLKDRSTSPGEVEQ